MRAQFSYTVHHYFPTILHLLSDIKFFINSMNTTNIIVTILILSI